MRDTIASSTAGGIEPSMGSGGLLVDNAAADFYARAQVHSLPV
jgi:hypothetical protein